MSEQLMYVVGHIPHASSQLPPSRTYLTDPRPEVEIVTDWFTDELFSASDYAIVFPLSRVWCDVERLRNDPLEAHGLGIYKTHSLSGEAIRSLDPLEMEEVMAAYDQHHVTLATHVASALPYMPVCLVDAHSFSDLQASFTEHAGQPMPDICLGFEEGHAPGDLVERLAEHFRDRGYGVEFNRPYAGTMIPDGARGHPDFASVMIEVNKRLYLDKPGIKSAGFTKLKQDVDDAIALVGATST